MSYDEIINRENDFSMDKVIQISKDLLPNQYRKRPWEYVNHGVGLLSTDNQLCAYIAAYGEMHQMKCRLAFQNFPFDELVSNFEIVDWGCGQGVASLTLIDMLKERGMINQLQKVTLVEPSKVALNRANANVVKVTNERVTIIPINKYLPGDGAKDEIQEVAYDYVTIHLFSNILDIEEVDLYKLANVVANPRHIHYIMCMGPMNTNSYRIQQFCNIFNVKEYISEINNPRQGYTSDTKHIYSCCTRCFKYEGRLSLQENVSSLKPISILNVPIYDDYDLNLLVKNKVISCSVYDFNEMLRDVLSDNDFIYLKPNVGGDKPDIVVVRKGKGLLVVHTFEDNLSDYDPCYDSNNSFNPYLLRDNNDNEIASPIAVIKSYQKNIIQLHLKDMLGRSLTDTKYWSLIKMVVYFPKNTTKEVQDFYGDSLKYVKVFGKDILLDGNKDDFLERINFTWDFSLFKDDIYRNVLKLLSTSWHSYQEGKDIKLSPEQKKLVISKAKSHHKINGSAGCGKTEVLVNRAVNAQIRTGRKILILTFNLSLVNYIRYRLSEIRADFLWDNFYIINYHQFFGIEANNLHLKIRMGSYEDEHFFEGSEGIEQYAAIFIDEVQDYKTEWLNILMKYFLAKDGEFIVFGDAKQNVYDRQLNDKGEINIGVISGGWNNSLSRQKDITLIGQRYINPALIPLFVDFQKTYFENQFIDDFPSTLFNQPKGLIKYTNEGNEISIMRLVWICVSTMKKYNIKPRDVVVLSQTCDILRDFEEEYCNKYHLSTLTTFETVKQYESLCKKYTDNEKWLIRDLEEIRRNKKNHFEMDLANLKLSTIHSYKGWESLTIFLILLPENKDQKRQLYHVDYKHNIPELIYTAITRTRQNLFIINYGNEKYHEFFKNNCH